MDDLQYYRSSSIKTELQPYCSFKPCYKWMTFNTENEIWNCFTRWWWVLNLVINGWPSILAEVDRLNEIEFEF